LNRGLIDTRVYENMLRSYSKRFTEVEEEITFLDAQEALKFNNWFSRLKRLFRRKR